MSQWMMDKNGKKTLVAMTRRQAPATPAVPDPASADQKQDTDAAQTDNPAPQAEKKQGVTNAH